MDHLGVFTCNEQPTTCPLCGNGTKISIDFFNTIAKEQHHQCFSNYCQFKFVVEVDDETEE